MTGRNETPRLPDDAPPAGEAPIPEPPRSDRSGPTTLAHWAAAIGATAVPADARMWALLMPAGQELLNANHRPAHWSARSRITHDLRWTAYVLAKKAKIPPLQRARIWCIYQPPPTRAVKDVGNLAPSAKALVDGAIGDAKVLPNDSDEYMVGPDMRRGDTHPQGRLVLLIAELPPKQETLHA